MSDLASLLNEDAGNDLLDEGARQADAAEEAAGEPDKARHQSLAEIEQMFDGAADAGAVGAPEAKAGEAGQARHQSLAEIEQMFGGTDEAGEVATPEVKALEQEGDAAATAAPAPAPANEQKPDEEPAWVVKARGYNRSHGDHVDQFNQATQQACVVGGEVSPPHVAGWQEQHGLSSDGKVGPKTAAAASQQAPAQPAAESATPAEPETPKAAPPPMVAPPPVAARDAEPEPAPAPTATPTEKPKSDAEKKKQDKLLRGQYEGLKKLFVAGQITMAEAVGKMIAYDKKLNGGTPSVEGVVLMSALFAELMSITVLKSSDSKPATPTAPTAPTTPTAPTAPTGGGGGAKAPATVAGAGAGLKSKSLAKQIASLNDPQVTAIADQLATLEQMKHEKKFRNQEAGESRDKLVAGIKDVRPKIAALPDTGVHSKIKAGFYRAVQDLNAFYEQYGNVDILEGKEQAKSLGKSTSVDTRTCNITSVSMALESLGKSNESYQGDRSKILAVARHWSGKIAKAGDSTHQGEGGWAEVAGLRLPDFMQLVVIADVMKSPDDDVEAATKQAWGWILNPKYLAYLPTLFGASGTVKYIGSGDSVDAYKANVLKSVGGELDAGAGIVVGLSGHYVRLQGFDDDGLVIDDPGGYTKANRKITWAEAREHSYFKSRVVVTG